MMEYQLKMNFNIIKILKILYQLIVMEKTITNNLVENITNKAIKELKNSLEPNKRTFEKPPHKKIVNLNLPKDNKNLNKDKLDIICSKKKNYNNFREEFIRLFLNVYSLLLEKSPLNISSSYNFEFIFLKFIYESYNSLYKILCDNLKEHNYEKYNEIINNKKVLLISFCKWFNKIFNYLVKNFSALDKYNKIYLEIINDKSVLNNDKSEYRKILKLKLNKYVKNEKKRFEFLVKIFDRDKKKQNDTIFSTLEKIKYEYYSFAIYKTSSLPSDVKEILNKYDIKDKNISLSSIKISEQDKLKIYKLLPKKIPKKLPFNMFNKLYYYYYCNAQMVYYIKIYSSMYYNKLLRFPLLSELEKIYLTHQKILECTSLKLKSRDINPIIKQYLKPRNFLEDWISSTWYFKFLISSYSSPLLNIIKGFNMFNLDIVISDLVIPKLNIKKQCVHLVGKNVIAIDTYLAFTAYIDNNKNINIFNYDKYVVNPKSTYLNQKNQIASINITNNSLEMIGYGNKSNKSTNKSKIDKTNLKKLLKKDSKEKSPRIKGGERNIIIKINKLDNSSLGNCFVFKLDDIIFYYLVKSPNYNNKWTFIRNCDKAILGILLPDKNYIIKKETKYKMSLKGELMLTTAEIFIFYLLSICFIYDIPKNKVKLDNIENLFRNNSIFIGENAECLRF